MINATKAANVSWITTFLMVIAKLAGTLNISWIWVLVPIWGWLAAVIVGFGFVLVYEFVRQKILGMDAPE